MNDFIDLLKVFLLSAVPVTEQRGAIPLGIFVYNLHPLAVFVASFLGSLLPVPFILLFFNVIFDWMKKIKIFRLLSNYIENKVVRGSDKVQKLEKIGLMIFVAIPLPTTGLWTGSAIAAFLKMDIKTAFKYITLGGLISAVVITTLLVLFPALLKFF
jgi:uncharacterized membrane protein